MMDEIEFISDIQRNAIIDVLNERVRQESKWGEQNHDPFTYGAILGEEFGELMQAALQTRYGGEKGGLDHLREEAVQTAAVALAVVECLDRGKWEWDTVFSDLKKHPASEPPDSSKDVMVFTKTGAKGVGWFSKNINCWFVREDIGFSQSDSVIEWRELK